MLGLEFVDSFFECESSSITVFVLDASKTWRCCAHTVCVAVCHLQCGVSGGHNIAQWAVSWCRFCRKKKYILKYLSVCIMKYKLTIKRIYNKYSRYQLGSTVPYIPYLDYVYAIFSEFIKWIQLQECQIDIKSK